MTKTLADTVYEATRADILACRIKPGVKLPISDLFRKFEVSPGAVREAMSRLAAEGLLTATPQRGYRVATVSDSELRDLTSARIELEAVCLRRSLRLGNLDWETQLVAAFHKLSRITRYSCADEGTSDDWAAAHGEFHLALVAACDSSWLLKLRVILYENSERYRRLSDESAGDNRDVDAEHRAIFEAAIDRKEALTIELMSAHIQKTTDILLNEISRKGPKDMPVKIRK